MKVTESANLPRAAVVERFKSKPIVVLSPHRDDACLSLGGLLKAIGHGLIVNLFTRSLTIAQAPISAVSEEMVEGIREEEDRKYIERSNLERREFRLAEPPVVGRYEFDVSHIEVDIAQLSPILMSTLTEFGGRQNDKRSVLFCPSGIGGHVNHLAAFETVLRNIDVITRLYDLMFYEDLPYASRARRRFSGIARLHQRAAPMKLVRNTYIPEWKDKKALVDIYASQFPESLTPRRLRPFVTWPLRPHEAFWSVAEEPPNASNREPEHRR